MRIGWLAVQEVWQIYLYRFVHLSKYIYIIVWAPERLNPEVRKIKTKNSRRWHMLNDLPSLLLTLEHNDLPLGLSLRPEPSLGLSLGVEPSLDLRRCTTKEVSEFWLVLSLGLSLVWIPRLSQITKRQFPTHNYVKARVGSIPMSYYLSSFKLVDECKPMSKQTMCFVF